MTNQQHLSRLTTDTAGNLRRLGCQVLAATAINGRPWIKAVMPRQITPQARISLLTAAWRCPAIIEWSVK